MRVADGWTDVTICNLSSRGLMAKCACPPRKGDYVEIRHRGASIVARVAWSHNARFGVRSQDAIDIAALLAESPLAPQKSGEERRVAERPRSAPRALSLHAQAERSRHQGRLFDWILVAAAALIGASQVVQVTADAFAEPLHVVQATLSTRQ
jgi:hypothetical protein